jgi:uncharacterized protein (DUF169 family)
LIEFAARASKISQQSDARISAQLSSTRDQTIDQQAKPNYGSLSPAGVLKLAKRGGVMTETNFKEIADFVRDNLRLKTFPVAVKFLKDKSDFPEKTRRPSEALQKKVTICQAVTMARVYGWTVGLAKEDLICVPAMIAFGFSGSSDPVASLTRLFCEVNFHDDEKRAREEISSMSLLENDKFEAMLLAPLAKGLYEPDTAVIYGNPAQVMRLIQAWVYKVGGRLASTFGGKVECSEYLIAPFKSEVPRVSIPGM